MYPMSKGGVAADPSCGKVLSTNLVVWPSVLMTDQESRGLLRMGRSLLQDQWRFIYGGKRSTQVSIWGWETSGPPNPHKDGFQDSSNVGPLGFCNIFLGTYFASQPKIRYVVEYVSI